jgi:hypothetical protein
MLLRLRWFIMGAVASVGVVSYLATQVRKARERLTPRNIANSGMRGVANLFDTAADAVQPTRENRR